MLGLAVGIPLGKRRLDAGARTVLDRRPGWSYSALGNGVDAGVLALVPERLEPPVSWALVGPAAVDGRPELSARAQAFRVSTRSNQRNRTGTHYTVASLGFDRTTLPMADFRLRQQFVLPAGAEAVPTARVTELLQQYDMGVRLSGDRAVAWSKQWHDLPTAAGMTDALLELVSLLPAEVLEVEQQ
jgi:hypothetical protein